MKVVILNSFLEYICKKGQGVNKMIDITKLTEYIEANFVDEESTEEKTSACRGLESRGESTR